ERLDLSNGALGFTATQTPGTDVTYPKLYYANDVGNGSSGLVMRAWNLGIKTGPFNDQTTKVTINSSGNVGIGTTTPDYKLDVQGDVNIGLGTNVYPTTPAGSAALTLNGSSLMRHVMNDGSGNYHQYLNSYYDSAAGAHKYAAASQANNFVTSQGTYAFYVAPVGTVGSNITWTTALYIDNAGKVGIGTAAPAYNLHVVGTAGLSSGTAWTNASDIRLKDIHGDYEYGLDEILKLHTVRYSYKKDNPLGLPSDFSKTGFIAQEVQKVIPDAVKKREDGYLELNVDPIHWAVVNSIKDLYRKHIAPLWESDKRHERAIASLKESNENLKKEKDQDIAKKDKEIAELKARLLKIEKMLQKN
ncbi:MAG: tail fiber domain-containing protein, partial [Bacteriovorax sp.]